MKVWLLILGTKYWDDQTVFGVYTSYKAAVKASAEDPKVKELFPDYPLNVIEEHEVQDEEAKGSKGSSPEAAG